MKLCSFLDSSTNLFYFPLMKVYFNPSKEKCALIHIIRKNILLKIMPYFVEKTFINVMLNSPVMCITYILSQIRIRYTEHLNSQRTFL